MADSIRELIIQSLAAQAAAITTANGYDLNVKTVARVRRFFEDSELPAIGIFDGEEPAEVSFNFSQNKMIVNVNAHSDAAAENRSIHANKMLAALKKGILSADETHAGKAQRTGITASSINYPADDDVTTVSVNIELTITYEEVIGDPYSNP